MQVQVAMNGSRPFKSPSLSPVPQTSTDLAHSLTRTVYEITTAAAETAEDKFNLGDEAVSYAATQYYTTVEPRSSASSPTMQAVSPKDSGNLTPISFSSKDSVSSENSSQEGSASMQQNMCLPAVSSAGGVDESGHSVVGGSVNAVKNWTYEDQFKQLYNLSPERERKEFLDNLFSFMQKKGTPITRVPIMAKQPLDLYKLFKLVVERGGLVEVIKKKAWRNVAKELNLPASITSAAFTMRSQYVKYLYPYECEVAKLSDPQELQMAIDSNKRDRRHSETVEFLAPQVSTDLEQAISPVTHNVTTAQGLQLLSSPTVAIPQGSMPPYSGGFIVTPGGTHVVGSPQLLQMAHHVPGIPIVLPASAAQYEHLRTCSSEDRDETESMDSASEPPAKKLAIDRSITKAVTIADSRLPFNIHTNAGNFIMSPGGTPVVRHPGALPTSGTPPTQFIQMSPHPHIPIMIPTPTTSTGTVAVGSAKEALLRHQNVIESEDKHHRRMLTLVNGPIPSSSLPVQSAAGGVVLSQHSPPIVSANDGTLVQMTSSPLVTMTTIEKVNQEEESSREEQAETRVPPNSGQKMSFANISIQSAGPKSEVGEADASLLVTLELNNTVYQGVLFAKPSNTAATSPGR